MTAQIIAPKLNLRKLNRALAHIEKFPETYDQNEVVDVCDITKKTPCGAIGCLGGWLVLLESPRKQRHELAQAGGSMTKPAPVQLIGNSQGTAQSLAGLTDDEAEYLFGGATGYPKKDLKTIKYRISQIVKARKTIAEFNRMFEKNDFEIQGNYSFWTGNGYEFEYQVTW